ncbi:hypothetical protein [[Clostridium] colinum]|uniref:hypothetical protein n=1 Tax=[Clostridium] colinum TaxID=36835 RepID=UPI002024330D|nr:hypothetical protein [[Clostridium] colinum]
MKKFDMVQERINSYLEETNNFMTYIEKYEFLKEKNKELEKEEFVLRMKLFKKTSEFRNECNYREGKLQHIIINKVIENLKPILNEYFLKSIKEEALN